MPLTAYGVIRGALVSHKRDDPDNFGRWRHIHLSIEAGKHFDLAVDVDSKQSNVGVQWRIITVPADRFGFPTLPSPGFIALSSAPETGALDYTRHLAVSGTWVSRWIPFGGGPLARFARQSWWPFESWKSGDWAAASTALESILRIGADVMAWGEPFPAGAATSAAVNGLHNIHQNQGDPVGSQWWAEDGIWQDGGLAVQQNNGTWRTFISRFSTQARQTDNAGHPI